MSGQFAAKRPASRSWSLVGAAAASAVGLAVSLYLGWLGATAAGGEASRAPFCGPGSSCQQVWISPFARMLGVGLPWWGAATYALLLVLLVGSRGARAGRSLFPLALGLSWAAAGFSLYLVGVQAWVLRGLCPWCLISAASAVAAAALATVAAVPGLRPSQAGNPPGRGRPVPGQPRPLPERSRDLPEQARRAGPTIAAAERPGRWADRWAAPAGVGLAALLAAFNWVQATGGLSPGRWEQTAGPARPSAATSTASRPRSLTELSALMAAGPASAAARVDVFADFQCPYCAMAAREIIAPLLAEDVAAGRMRLTFYNFAFIGPESKRAAEAAACAAIQGRFWPFHDRLFRIQGRENSGVYNRERLLQLAEQEGLDVPAFSRCLSDSTIRRFVEESYELGRSLGVRGTPAFVVNGRVLEGLVPLDELRRAAYGG